MKVVLESAKYSRCKRKNVEPWIHASKCMISMGCTTAVQSLLAGKPVIEIQCPDEDNIPSAGFASQLSALV